MGGSTGSSQILHHVNMWFCETAAVTCWGSVEIRGGTGVMSGSLWWQSQKMYIKWNICKWNSGAGLVWRLPACPASTRGSISWWNQNSVTLISYFWGRKSPYMTLTSAKDIGLATSAWGTDPGRRKSFCPLLISCSIRCMLAIYPILSTTPPFPLRLT